MEIGALLKASLPFIGFLLVLGCGDSEKDDADSVDDGRSGTCDASESDGECTEVAGAPIIVSSERDFCLQSSGTWTTDPCPEGPNLIGCCRSSVGAEWLDCTYTDGVDNPEEACTALGDEWRPGSR